ncbi:Stage II sporulation protein related to metaloproteases (SpoIIQ) [Paenibacillus pasadenensis]|uniref:Stage II sporulation protein related to metaloproteases (SpoIIQ) n=1 Tax=Paenibacillus pasadenensis TaxID=217090 RepID=A0A2N5NDH4_9BACL|nr:M23 family metallopeptidase [Paenibacillus pasadenensis]PLT48394.1 Stage II sporulation protein related to metaloproteases (SpoIIQ) [Paenibacillus pasadenensis]
MNEQDQKNAKQDPPKNQLGGRKPASTYKKTLSRKWISPAIFVAAAAIIVTVMWLYQGDEQKTSTTETPESAQTEQGGQEQIQETVKPVPGETALWPVASVEDVLVKRGYFDRNASAAEQEASLVEQGNTYKGNTGIDLARADDQPFDVQAVLSGKVTLVQDQPTNGTVVEIAHGNGLVSVYQSLSGVTVKPGDEVKQATVIGKAGRNDLQKELGVHLHFALLKNDEHVDPSSLLPAAAPQLQTAAAQPEAGSSAAPDAAEQTDAGAADSAGAADGAQPDDAE